MSYFNMVCDSCGREVQGITWVNGMKFCAKCYQEIFGNKNMTENLKNMYEAYLKILNEKDQQIAELEEQLKNAIRPKFRTYQSIFYITQFYTSTKGNPEYDIISDKYYVAENENEIILGWNYANDFNQRKYYYVRKDWVFATKAEAEAKLRELQEKKKIGY